MSNNLNTKIYNNLKSKFNEVEHYRETYRKRMKTYIIILIFVLINMGLLFILGFMSDKGNLPYILKSNEEKFFIILFFLGFIPGRFLLRMQKKMNKSNENLKNELIPYILDEINPTLIYMASPSIEKEEILEPEFSFFNNIKAIKIEDMINGVWNGHEFLFCESKLADIRTNADNKKEALILFSGLFLKIDYHKKFNGITEIITNASPLNIFSKNNYPLVSDLENTEFNNIFKVYSTDEIESRYILSLPLMEKILSLKRKYKMLVLHILFCNNNIYILATIEKNLFEIDLKKEFSKENIIDPIINELKFIDDIFLTLNLDKKQLNVNR